MVEWSYRASNGNGNSTTIITQIIVYLSLSTKPYNSLQYILMFIIHILSGCHVSRPLKHAVPIIV